MKVVRRHFSTIESTNSWAKLHLNEFDPLTLTLITADEQTGGRGQFQRRWLSPPHENIYATFVFFMETRKDLVHLPQVLALSVAKVIPNVHIKLPNDIYLSGKKLGGILCETSTLNDKISVVMGLGLNVNMPQETADKIDQPATSLFIETKQQHNRESLLEEITQAFMGDLEVFLKNGFDSFTEFLKP